MFLFLDLGAHSSWCVTSWAPSVTISKANYLGFSFYDSLCSWVKHSNIWSTCKWGEFNCWTQYCLLKQSSSLSLQRGTDSYLKGSQWALKTEQGKFLQNLELNAFRSTSALLGPQHLPISIELTSLGLPLLASRHSDRGHMEAWVGPWHPSVPAMYSFRKCPWMLA